ncbi:LemA family protein [Solidesulfovibrio fructosivorans JJ]]|uniref:LemA family protein n=1 Tax=Solidesulfovibrio fructosivorans JJ] TaxID=596151 RepID=E1JUE6_SOLFR|nr:LemA family protein [Solidesulfovibrio fructosivorans]EFL52076.1 LemA family protein [Solidesulfovibrio fructosivorans JJ]]
MPRLLGLLIALLMLSSLSGCGYNQMQTNEEAVNGAWGNVESALQRRLDLIPNLVETVKGYASHEKDTLTAVVDARAKATQVKITPETLNDPKAMAAFQQAQGQMQSSLSRLLAIAENYPQLKADQNFRDLQNQLEGTENRINVARQRYNQAVETYNASIRTFPNFITNSLLLHLKPKEYFKADEAAKQAPKVKF